MEGEEHIVEGSASKGNEITPEGQTVKNSWLRAFLIGTAILPQSADGLRAYTAQAIFEDPVDDLALLEESYLTRRQIVAATRRMDRLHELYRIPAKSPGYRGASVGRRFITEEDLQHIWQLASLWFVPMLGKLLKHLKKIPSDIQFTPVEANAFFTEKGSDFFLIASLIRSFKESIGSSEIKVRGQEYRTGFSRSFTPHGVMDDIRKEVGDIAKSKFGKSHRFASSLIIRYQRLLTEMPSEYRP